MNLGKLKPLLNLDHCVFCGEDNVACFTFVAGFDSCIFSICAVCLNEAKSNLDECHKRKKLKCQGDGTVQP